MAYFKICVRAKRKDNTYPVYIRVTHHEQVGYIKTDKVCKAKSVRKGEVIDNYIIKDISILIDGYMSRLNREDIQCWDIRKILDFLRRDSSAPSFSEFCEEFTSKMDNEGRESTSINYKLALRRLEEYMGKDDILFSDLTSSIFKEWIDSMKDSLYKKHGYPKRIKTMFMAGCERYNNYDTGEMLIRNNPFRGVRVPRPTVPEKRALDIRTVRDFFAVSAEYGSRADRARDVCEIVFCLAGINTADLYYMEKENLRDGKMCYCRRKTTNRRDDKAYIEIAVPDRLSHLLEKYAGEKRLFNFCETYGSSKNFNKCINEGISDITRKNDLPHISVYSFRHSWATFAQNDFDASLDLVGFCLNHASSHRVTSGYVKTDFSVIDRLNAKILDYVFEEKNEKKMEIICGLKK